MTNCICCRDSGSWTFPQKELDLLNSTPNGVVDYYIENDAWELMGVTAHRSINVYPGLIHMTHKLYLSNYDKNRTASKIFYIPCKLIFKFLD